MKYLVKKQHALILIFTAINLCAPTSQLSAAPFGPFHPGKIIEHLPNGFRALNKGLFFHDGLFFRPASRGFRIIPPPVGIIIASLPAGSIALTIGGIDYYYCHNVYYRPLEQGYQVVEEPVVLSQNQSLSDQVAAGDEVSVLADRLNLRNGPGTKHAVTQTLPKGTTLKVTAVVSGWYFVELENGDTGWVMARHTDKTIPYAEG